MATSAVARAGPPKRALAIIFGVSIATALGNNGLLTVLPAIGRSIGIPDEMVVAVFSLSAVMWAIASPAWARASDRFGRKPLIMLGLAGFMVSMAAGGVVVSAGLRHLATPVVIFVLFLLARSLFGLFGSAANPASQAYVADQTPPDQRTQAMASLAGAVGLGTVVGPLLAPLFIFPVLGLAGPLFSFAVIAAAMLVVVWRFLPRGAHPAVIPFLIFGFLVATGQTAQQQTLGFLIIDKLHVSPLDAQHDIAIAMMFGAVAGLLAQWGIIRMFEMAPRQLLRWGVGCAAVGNLLVAASPGYSTVVAGYALASLGFGLARPGFTAGASLAVKAKDQARVAGAIAAVNGINGVLAPAFMVLYHLHHSAPFLLNMALMLGLLVYAVSNSRLRAAGPEPAGVDASTIAALERSDEAG